jgi:hypothetical protein
MSHVRDNGCAAVVDPCTVRTTVPCELETCSWYDIAPDVRVVSVSGDLSGVVTTVALTAGS